MGRQERVGQTIAEWTGRMAETLERERRWEDKKELDRQQQSGLEEWLKHLRGRGDGKTRKSWTDNSTEWTGRMAETLERERRWEDKKELDRQQQSGLEEWLKHLRGRRDGKTRKSWTDNSTEWTGRFAENTLRGRGDGKTRKSWTDNSRVDWRNC